MKTIIYILIGIVIGNVATSVILDPLPMYERALTLATNAYYLGCVESHGNACKIKTKTYYDKLKSI